MPKMQSTEGISLSYKSIMLRNVVYVGNSQVLRLTPKKNVGNVLILCSEMLSI